MEIQISHNKWRAISRKYLKQNYCIYCFNCWTAKKQKKKKKKLWLKLQRIFSLAKNVTVFRLYKKIFKDLYGKHDPSDPEVFWLPFFSCDQLTKNVSQFLGIYIFLFHEEEIYSEIKYVKISVMGLTLLRSIFILLHVQFSHHVQQFHRCMEMSEFSIIF